MLLLNWLQRENYHEVKLKKFGRISNELSNSILFSLSSVGVLCISTVPATTSIANWIKFFHQNWTSLLFHWQWQKFRKIRHFFPSNCVLSHLSCQRGKTITDGSETKCVSLTRRTYSGIKIEHDLSAHSLLWFQWQRRHASYLKFPH